MAQGENKEINQLEQATEIQDADLFVLEQGGDAKKLLGSTLKSYAEEAGINAIREIYPRTPASNDPDNSVFDVEIPDAGEAPMHSTVIKGKTAAVNQLVSSVYAQSETYGITRTAVGVGGLRVSGTSTNSTTYSVELTSGAITGHTYLFTLGNVSLPSGSRISASTVDKETSAIITSPSNLNMSIYIASGTAIDVTVYPMVVDLTACGFTSAETTDVATLKSAWLKKYGTPLPQYIPYDAGSLANVNGKYRVRGRNIWDGEYEHGSYGTNGNPTPSTTNWRTLNPIPVIDNQTYFINSSGWQGIKCYDANDKFISNSTYTSSSGGYLIYFPAGTRFIRIAFTSEEPINTCVNLSDASFNGTDKPYYDGGEINCSNAPLNGIGTAQDEVDYASGKRTTKCSGIITLDGTTTISDRGLATGRISFDISLPMCPYTNTASTPLILSDKLKTISQNASWNPASSGDYVSRITTSNTTLYLGAVRWAGMTLTQVSADLASNPIHFVYAITPTTTTETPQPLNTQYGYNVFEPVSGGVQSAEVDTIFYENIAGYIDKRLNGG